MKKNPNQPCLSQSGIFLLKVEKYFLRKLAILQSIFSQENMAETKKHQAPHLTL